MTHRDPRITLGQMADHTEEVIGLTATLDREELESNRILSLAVVRLLEIIGEAAARVPEAERANYPEIPWREIVDLRNRLIHGYDSIDYDVLWSIIKHDLPPLAVELQQILS